MKPPANEPTAPMEREIARLRGDLLTVARRCSHDLRTPLGGIVTTAEAIREILAHCDPSAVPLAESLLNSAEDMSPLIKQVSFVSRASANPLPKTDVHMAEPVFIALQRLESRILKRQATVTEPPTWPVVAGVPSWLEAIWWQFLLNALRHGGEKCRIELGWTPQNDSLRFWLSDNGPGVPPALHGKLFATFDSLHAEPGVPGLGLSIVQRLVELQGGQCGHETPASGGALFSSPCPSKRVSQTPRALTRVHKLKTGARPSRAQQPPNCQATENFRIRSVASPFLRPRTARIVPLAMPIDPGLHFAVSTGGCGTQICPVGVPKCVNFGWHFLC